MNSRREHAVATAFPPSGRPTRVDLPCLAPGSLLGSALEVHHPGIGELAVTRPLPAWRHARTPQSVIRAASAGRLAGDAAARAVIAARQARYRLAWLADSAGIAAAVAVAFAVALPGCFRDAAQAAAEQWRQARAGRAVQVVAAAPEQAPEATCAPQPASEDEPWPWLEPPWQDQTSGFRAFVEAGEPS